MKMKMKIKRNVQNGTDKICVYGVPLTKCLCEGEADRQGRRMKEGAGSGTWYGTRGVRLRV